MAYINNKTEFLNKSVTAMSGLADDFVFDVDSQTTDLDIGFEMLTYNLMQQQASDSTLSEDQQANALTVLVDDLDLNNVPASLTYALPVSYVAASTITIPHNTQTTGKQGGSSANNEFYHLTQSQLQKLNNLILNPEFADIGGDPLNNSALSSLFNGKQSTIATGSAGQFYAWDKTMRQVLFSQIGGKPTTLAGYGISVGDTLFDNKYIQPSGPITGYTIGANAILANTDTWIGALGKLQSQISNREEYLGLPAVNGYVLSSTTAGVRSWVPFAGGGTVNSVAIASTNGFTGSSVTAAGVSTVTLRTSITGILKGDGTAISAAVPMTDYLDTTGAADGDTILYTGGVATWSPGLVNPMDGPGQMIYGGVAGVTTKLAANATSTNRFLRSVSSGNPSWEILVASDIPNIAISQVTDLENTLDGYLTDSLAVNTLFMGNAASAAVNSKVAGDLTAVFAVVSGTNEAQFTIANGVVSYAKIQNVQSQTILGRYALTNGVAQELFFKASDFAINSSTGEIGLVSPNTPILTNKGDILTHTGVAIVRLGIGANGTFFMADSTATTGNKWVTMSGDAAIATSGAITIASGAVTLGKMANLAANSFIGNNTGSAATPIALTATQATAMLNQFTPLLKGLVPAASGGLDATYFLNATGAWSVPAGGGGGSGTVTSASQYSIPYYSVSPTGTTVSGLAPQTANGVYFLRANVTASVAVAPDWIGSTGSGSVVLATNPVINSPRIGAGGGQGHFHMHFANSAPTGIADYITVFGDTSPNKKLGFLFELDAFESYFQFNATTASKTYAFPDFSGTVALLANAAAFTSVTVGTASSLAGDVVFQNAANATTQTFRGTNPTSSIVYLLPATAPAAGEVLSSSAPSAGVSTLSWTSLGSGVADGTYGQVSVTGSGTVWTPANLDGSNFAAASGFTIFANITGSASQPTFATGTEITALLDEFIGTSGVATRKGLVPAPILVTDVGKFLRADGTWQTVSGSGDMVLATPQTVTGAKTFGSAGAVGKLIVAGSTSGTTIINAAAVAGTTAVTLPAANATLAGINFAQTWTAAQTFNTNTLGFRNAANTATTTIAGGASAASYTLTIPTLTASTSFAVLNVAQTFTAAQTVQINSAVDGGVVLGVNNTSTSSAGRQIAISVSLAGTHPTTITGKTALYAGYDHSIVLGNIGNNFSYMTLTTGGSFLLGTTYAVGMGLQFRNGYYYSNSTAVLTNIPTRSAANYYYSHYSDIYPDAGSAITVASATDPIYTQYTRIATAGSPSNSFNTRVPAANPYVGSMIEVWPSVTAAATLQTGARISTAQYSQTFSTNVTALFSTLIGHWNEYFTAQGSSTTTFTSFIQHALWHQNSSNSTSGNVVGLKIYRTVGTQTLLTKAGIYIDNQTSTASVTNPRTQVAFTNAPTFTNAPWSIFVENDKANFGGGILIDPSATLTTVLTATAALEIISTTKGVRFPNMTTAEKNAIANTAGLVVFDTTLAKLCVNSGSGWQIITSL